MRPTKIDKRRASSAPSGSQRVGRIGVRLHYEFDVGEQQGDSLENPVIEILTAVAQAGSIRHAAQNLNKSYRHVWGTLRHWERVFGEPLISWSQGQRARLTAFAEQLLRAEQQARERARPHIETLRSDLARVLVETGQDRSQALKLHASHDLALPVLRQYLAEHENLKVELEFQGSVDALRSLRERRCLVAGFHVPNLSAAAPIFSRALRPLLDPVVHRIVTCSQRTQGLMMRKEHSHRVRGMDDVVAQKLRFVNRQLGSGTRMLIEHLIHTGSINTAEIRGFASHIESSHLSAALCIAGGVADVGVGVEAAALNYGLHFSPLVKENYFLAFYAEDVEQPGIKRLRRALTSPAWRGILSSLPGYEAAERMGEVRSISSTIFFDRIEYKGTGLAQPKA